MPEEQGDERGRQEEARDDVAPRPPAVGERAAAEGPQGAGSEEEEQERPDDARILPEEVQRNGTNVTRPNCVQARTVTTPIRRAIAPRMSRLPRRRMARALRAGAETSAGSASAISAATSRPAPGARGCPAGRIGNENTASGPSAMPMFPPIEKSDRPVALRSPATWFAVR
jgi:hypothetical protein